MAKFRIDGRDMTPKWMLKTKFKNWLKERWSKDGRWFNFTTKEELAIGNSFGGFRHIFLNGETIKVVKTATQALAFAKSYMRSH